MRPPKRNIEQEERSLLWSFCQAADILYEQFDRLEKAGTLSYSLLRSLIGESSQKGLLWYVKDKAHTLFEDSTRSDSPGALLDWSLGYIFHESVKLMEDTRLQQAYVVRFDKFTQNCPQCAHLFEQFDEIEKQTRRSIAYEAKRLDVLLLATMDLFGQYFSGRINHRPLARLLYDQEALFRRVFRNRYPAFLQSVYADKLYCLYVEAGNSLLEAGKLERARTALAEAMRLSECETVRQFERTLVAVSSEVVEHEQRQQAIS